MSSNHLSLYEISGKVNHEVSYLRNYLDHLNETVLKNKASVQNSLEEEFEEFGYHSGLEDAYEDDIVKFPSYFYHSSFLLVYSLLESTFLDLCNLLHLQLNLPLKIDDLKGNNYLEGSFKYIDYFTPIGDILKEKYPDLKNHQLIRNFIVHNASINPRAKGDGNKNKLFASSIHYYRDGSFYIKNVDFVKNFLLKVDHLISTTLSALTKLEIKRVEKVDNELLLYFIKDNVIYNLGMDDDLPF